MRTYLVIMDESDEAEVALRFAARRASKTGGSVRILALVPPAEFVQWGGVQATMEEEARQRAEALVMGSAGTLMQELGVRPVITVKSGEPIPTIRKILDEDENISALVLGAAAGRTRPTGRSLRDRRIRPHQMPDHDHSRRPVIRGNRPAELRMDIYIMTGKQCR